MARRQRVKVTQRRRRRRRKRTQKGGATDQQWINAIYFPTRNRRTWTYLL